MPKSQPARLLPRIRVVQGEQLRRDLGPEVVARQAAVKSKVPGLPQDQQKIIARLQTIF